MSNPSDGTGVAKGLARRCREELTMAPNERATMAQTPHIEKHPPCKRGFGPLTCPLCGHLGKISVDLDNLSDLNAFECRECNESFSVDTVRVMIAEWQRVLIWLETAPTL